MKSYLIASILLLLTVKLVAQDTLPIKVQILPDGKVKVNYTEGRTLNVALGVGDLSAKTEAVYFKNLKLKSFPSEIFNCPNIEILLLDENQITEIPASISKLKKLKILSLSYNTLSSISTTIGALKGLEYINLELNKLEYLPEEIGQLSGLKSLNIYNNKLKSLPQSIGNLTQLQYLNISTNQITEIIPKLGQCKKLRSLNLMRNPITILPETIGNLDSLENLSLFETELSQIPSFLKKFKFYHELVLTSDMPPPFESYSGTEVLFTNTDDSNVNYGLLYTLTKNAIQKDNKNYALWHNLGWYALFVKEYKESIDATEISLTLNPNNHSARVNLVSALLLLNNFNAAKKEVLTWRYRFLFNNKRFKFFLLEDIATLEKFGIKSPNFEKIKNLLH